MSARLPAGWWLPAVLLCGVLGSACSSAEMDDKDEKPVPGLAHYTAHGISFDYPAHWRLLEQDLHTRTSTVVAFVGTAPAQSGCLTTGNMTTCGTDWRLQPGTVSVRLTLEGGGPVQDPVFERPLGDGAQRLEIDGLPAIFARGEKVANADISLRWTLSMPESMHDSYGLTAAIRGPGVDEMFAQLQDLVSSIRYDPPVTRLEDGPARDAAVARALNTLAASDPSFECFPRVAGESRQAVIREVPFHAPLRRPLPVRCSTDVEATPLAMWRLTLTIAWDAADDRQAGMIITRVWVTAHGEPGTSEGEGSDTLPYWP